MSSVLSQVGFKGFHISKDKQDIRVPFLHCGQEYQLAHGSVVIAAVISCTNNCNPSVMLTAGTRPTDWSFFLLVLAAYLIQFSDKDGASCCLSHTGFMLSLLYTGLLAKKAVEAGLVVKPYIRTSLAPGSGMVTHYLNASGVLPYFKQLG